MASPVTERAAELEARAAAFVREHRLPGVAAGVVHGDELAWSTGLGFADVATRRPPYQRTASAGRPPSRRRPRPGVALGPSVLRRLDRVDDG